MVEFLCIELKSISSKNRFAICYIECILNIDLYFKTRVSKFRVSEFVQRARKQFRVKLQKREEWQESIDLKFLFLQFVGESND